MIIDSGVVVIVRFFLVTGVDSRLISRINYKPIYLVILSG